MQEIRSKDISFDLLDNGAIGIIKAKDTMINQVKGNSYDGSLMNLYLRLTDDGGKNDYAPLIGPNSESNFFVDQNSARWEGQFLDISYVLTLNLIDNMWFWKINVKGKTKHQVDLTYVQDLGLGAESFVTANEAYSSQYIDNYVVKDGEYITVCSRQNQSQSGKYPYLQQGSLSPLASYATDGFQFYGTEYKLTDIPTGLIEKQLPSDNYQYEFTLTALRTPSFEVGSEETTHVFYAAYVDSRESGNNSILLDFNDIKEKYSAFHVQSQNAKKVYSEQRTEYHPLAGRALTTTEINKLYPRKEQIEEDTDSELLSFFDTKGRHIVLPAKEKKQERMTGNIIMAGASFKPGAPVMATTQYMCGIFESQTVFGNTNMNILTTNVRNSLNYFKNSGTRILVKISGKYRLLTMPSLFAMSFNGADWIYKLEDDVLLIRGEASADTDQLRLEFISMKQKKYDIKVITQLELATLGENVKVDIQDAK
ncbi:MAG: cellobiose phosphorylase, partial [Liquorilactobacillus hordei]